MNTNSLSRKNILLNAAIVLLVAFSAIQTYGIVSKPSKHPVVEPVRGDSTTTAIQINILNGCGTSGIGGKMTDYCRAIGYDVVEMGNYKSFDLNESMVIDRSGKMEVSKILAQKIGISPKNVVQQFSNEHLVVASVVIGKDYKKLNPWNK